MAKNLISFLALNNDVVNSTISEDSPNYNIHKYFYNYDIHHLIFTSEDHRKLVQVLIAGIEKDFPDHKIIPHYISISDPIDLIEIRDKLFLFLSQMKDSEVDLFMSPGTPTMQIVWFLLHVSGIANTRLIQSRKAKDSKTGIPEFFFVDIEKSSIPYGAVLKYSFPSDSEFKYPIGEAIKDVFCKAKVVALTDNVTVLIRGESGTGKEYLARYIHDNSSRRNNQFIAVNCSSLNDELLESRLFGHKQGSFTGAIKDQIGFFEVAKGGTIFLDEVGDMTPRLQQSLLRVIQESEILPIGESKPRKINVRMIFATNKDLENFCFEGKFRWDLYYRLNVVELELPPLRLRGENDFNELLQFLNKEKAIKFSKKPLRFSKEAYSVLNNYSFPGNVRELENIIESLHVFKEKTVEKEDLPKRLFNPSLANSLKWADVTLNHFKFVLDQCDGNKSKAAKILGCSLNTLKKYLE